MANGIYALSQVTDVVLFALGIVVIAAIVIGVLSLIFIRLWIAGDKCSKEFQERNGETVLVISPASGILAWDTTDLRSIYDGTLRLVVRRRSISLQSVFFGLPTSSARAYPIDVVRFLQASKANNSGSAIQFTLNPPAESFKLYVADALLEEIEVWLRKQPNLQRASPAVAAT